MSIDPKTKEELREAIFNFDFHDYLGKTFPDSLDAPHGEVRLNCFSPNGCSGSDQKYHLYVNPDKRTWHCFKCGYGSSAAQPRTSWLPVFIADAEDIPLHTAITQILQVFSFTPEDDLENAIEARFNEPRTPEEKEITKILLPSQFYKLFEAKSLTAAPFKEYLASRGINESDIERYDIRYCTSSVSSLPPKHQDVWRGRVIFPVYDQNGVCRSAVGRAIKDNPKRWINWMNSDLKHFTWPAGEFRSGKFEPYSFPNCVTLVEGIFDALAVSKIAHKFVQATLGKKISVEQSMMLKKNSVEKLILAWDYEAKKDMARLIENSDITDRFEVKVIPFLNVNLWRNKDFGDALNETEKDVRKHLPAELELAIDTESTEYIQWVMS